MVSMGAGDSRLWSKLEVTLANHSESNDVPHAYRIASDLFPQNTRVWVNIGTEYGNRGECNKVLCYYSCGLAATAHEDGRTDARRWTTWVTCGGNCETRCRLCTCRARAPRGRPKLGRFSVLTIRFWEIRRPRISQRELEKNRRRVVKVVCTTLPWFHAKLPTFRADWGRSYNTQA